MSDDDDMEHPTDFIDNNRVKTLNDEYELTEPFLHSICEEIDKGNIEEGSEQYQEWIRKGPTYKPGYLKSIWDSTDKRDCVRLSALFGSLLRQGHIFNEEHMEMVERYSQTFESRPIYQYCRFKIYSPSKYPEHREKTFVNGLSAAESIKRNPSLHSGAANAGIELIRRTNRAPIEFEDEEMDQGTILSKSAEYAEKAVKHKPEGTSYYLTWASVLQLQEEYDQALEILHRGREQCLYQGETTDHFDDQIEEIENERRSYRLEQNIREADDRIENIGSELNRVEEELDEAVDDYRSEIFQFIGFFAAILTIALTSVQIATELSFPQSGGLVLILIGGITVSFGELEALFGDTHDGDGIQNSRTLIVGSALIVVGVGIGVGLLDILPF